MTRIKNMLKSWLKELSGEIMIFLNQFTSGNSPVVIILSKGKHGHSKNVSKAAKELGFQVQIFCPEFPVNEAYYASKWHRIDCETDYALATKIAGKLNPTAVLVESKHSLLVMQNELARATGCIAVGYDSSVTSNSKSQMREALKGAQIGTLNWYDFEKLKINEKEPAQRYVYKPEVGSGSAGVRLIRSHIDLEDLRAEYHNRDGILEEFVVGRQFDLEGIAVDGEYFPLCLVEEHYGDAPPFFPPSWFLFNPPIDNVTRLKIVENAKQALKALGVKNGAWHIEQRLRNNDNTDIVVLDYANRMGYNKLVSYATRQSFPKLYVQSMLPNKNSFRDYTHDKDLGCLLKIYAFDEDQKNKLLSFAKRNTDMVLEIRSLPQKIGDWTFLGFVVFKSDDFDRLFLKLSSANLLPQKLYDYYRV